MDDMQLQKQAASLRTIINDSKRLCVFTGAGISCPSGIPDFRSEQGLYRGAGEEEYSPEEIISHSFFISHPELFYRFYLNKMVYPDAKPNAAHRFFAALENDRRDVTVVTQNIDGLHEKAGSSHVCTLHGTIHKNRCTCCGRFFDLAEMLNAAKQSEDSVPRCPADGGVIKPEVVLYEESLDQATIIDAVDAISKADTMIIVGTSLAVYPAASFIRYFNGKHLILINRTKTPYDSRADLIFYEDVIRVVNALAQQTDII